MTTKPRTSSNPNRSPRERTPRSDKPAGSTKPTTSLVLAHTSKHQRCLDLLARREGATLSELIAATHWQPHSIRGFLSGTVKKKLGLTLQSACDDDGNRRYRIDRAGRGR